jgi:N-acetylglucosaminyldiphosphoundecaprenol N-acetyl-beta-D-mannosaminyltransferase
MSSETSVAGFPADRVGRRAHPERGPSPLDFPLGDETECVRHGAARTIPSLPVNGVRVDPGSLQDLVERVEGFLRCDRSHAVHFVPADPTVLARRDRRYRAILNDGDLNVPDGASVAWVLRLNGHRTARVSGTEAFLTLAEWGLGRGLRHYLYGGRPEVAHGLRRRLEREFPGVRVAGCESPPFRLLHGEDLAAAARRARKAGTDLFWVGLGTPKQDVVAARLRDLQAAPVILCVGAAFDFLSGAKRRAPEWMQAAGLEWLHRLVSEPRRLWRRYLLGNPAFVLGVVVELVGRRGWRP